MVKFKLENIGLVEKAEILLNDFTLVCGQNNTGKTYITYSIYGFLYSWNNLVDFNIDKSVFEELEENGFYSLNILDYEKSIKHILKNLSQNYLATLPKIFNSPDDWFNDSKFEVILDNFKLDLDTEVENTFSSSKKDILKIKKEKKSSILEISTLSNIKRQIPRFVLESGINRTLGDIFFKEYFKIPFIITSERTGISLFYKELDISKNVLVEHLQKNSKDIDPVQIYKDSIARYAMPIKNNIDFRRDLEEEGLKNKSFLFDDKEVAKYFTEMLNGGMYKFIKNEGVVLVTKKTKTKEAKKIPIYLTSSASKSLLDLYVYITKFAQKDEILIIDEPELNLHPDNHILMARLLVYLLNKGIRVFITTHSDYLVKELNNLIRLKNNLEHNAKKKIFKDYGYKEHDILDYKKISAYINNLGNVEQVNDISNMGMGIKTFDDTINKLSNAIDDIYFNIEE